MNGLELWDQLEKTDPKYTKQFKRGGGFGGTAINGTYILKRLTATFGPCGYGWRFVIEDERIEEGHTLKSGDRTKVHILRGHIDYRIENEWHSTSPQFGQTMLVDENKNGPFTDEEAPKKSITDCISKCAVLLGIGADIHLGLFDDSKYVNERKREEAQAHQAPARVPQAEPPRRTNLAEAKAAADASLPDPSLLITAGQRKNFAMEWKSECPETWDQAKCEAERREWLRSRGYVDSLGQGTTAMIPKAAFLKVRAEAIEYIRDRAAEATEGRARVS